MSTSQRISHSCCAYDHVCIGLKYDFSILLEMCDASTHCKSPDLFWNINQTENKHHHSIALYVKYLHLCEPMKMVF